MQETKDHKSDSAALAGQGLTGVAFTPGPWVVGVAGHGKPGYVYCDNSLGSAVAICYGEPLAWTVFSRAEEEANARLIAAAPDLLRACMSMLAERSPVARLSDACLDARAAIAKAVGQSPSTALAGDQKQHEKTGGAA